MSESDQTADMLESISEPQIMRLQRKLTALYEKKERLGFRITRLEAELEGIVATALLKLEEKE